MKIKSLFSLLFLMISVGIYAQNINSPNIVFTGAPFLRIPPDARSGGLGDQGVATSPDVFSQYWNPAKYLFSTSYSSVGVSYTPYLTNLTNDIFLLNGSYFTFLGDEERSTLGINLYYFNLGEIELNRLGADGTIIPTGNANPNEFSISASYGLKLAETFGMAVGLAYIRSDLNNGVTTTQDVTPGTSVAVSIGGYYQSERHYFRNFEGKLRLGFGVSNIGPKLDYSSSDDNQAYLPTTLRLGAGYDFIFDEYSRLAVTYETSKLLVPTPDIPIGTDADGNGVIEGDEITGYRQDTTQGVVGSIFSSFGDAPGGASEEFQEFTHSLALEYSYNQALFLRGGYFYEAPDKGDRQHVTLGIGLKLNAFGIDASYLIPVSDTNSALENTLRFGLTFDIGGEAYSNIDY